jgi:hypothetical protein
MANENKDSLFWPIVIIVVIVSALSQMFNRDNNTVATSYTPSNTSAEHRYVKERVKLEGYSDKESAQAADAIIRFHEAQKARK